MTCSWTNCIAELNRNIKGLIVAVRKSVPVSLFWTFMMTFQAFVECFLKTVPVLSHPRDSNSLHTTLDTRAGNRTFGSDMLVGMTTSDAGNARIRHRWRPPARRLAAHEKRTLTTCH
jgi:hypothetical protein